MESAGMRPKRRRTEQSPSRQRQEAQVPRQLQTTLFVANVHCPSCVNTIEETLSALTPRPLNVSVSIVSHSVSIFHSSKLAAATIVRALETAGFDIHSAFQESDERTTHQILPGQKLGEDWEDNLEQAVTKWRQAWRAGKGKETDTEAVDEMTKRQKHAAHCTECQAELNGGAEHNLPLTQYASSLRSTPDVKSNLNSTSAIDLRHVDDGPSSPRSDISSGEKFGVTVDPATELQEWRVELAIVGMTCSSCVGAITNALEQLPYVRSVNVALLTNSASVTFEGKDRSKDIVEAVEDCGFDATIETLEKTQPKTNRQSQASSLWRATYSIEGMSCSSCTGAVTRAVKELPSVESVDVNLIANSATVVFRSRDDAEKIRQAIEDAGFDATLEGLSDVIAHEEEDSKRTVWIRVEGMYCHHCPTKILGALEGKYVDFLEIEKSPDLKDPILRIRYSARLGKISIRTILATIQEADPSFQPTVYHPATLEDKSRELQTRERHRVLFRLGLSATVAIPTLILGVVAMSLLPSDNPFRMYIMEPMWAGSVSRVQWGLFFLATPVYFFAADAFHHKSIKELKVLWRPSSTVPIWKRFVRFGSMNLLMSLGTTIAYVASIAELIIAALQEPGSAQEMDEINNSFYFDSVVFLCLFILAGRYLEAYSKAKTGDAVASLGSLRPSEAMLVDDSTKTATSTPVDLLDVGDVVRVAHGASPPFDGTVVEGQASFDESSLTGESRLVPKNVGDTVFSGTVNKADPISIRITSVSGTSMLDQIIKVVREGQTRRAPVERVADVITSHFVPFVVAVGITTWIIWLALGLSGALPRQWLDVPTGGWPLWSLKFAIATFVVACPCGIGLAAPTALFVGGGMAAKHGILVKGGGEAFQEASALDCIVFDKTGTITEGGEPSVTDYKRCGDDKEVEVLGMAKAIEEQSGHPIAGAVVDFCKTKDASSMHATNVEEVPGMGMQGSFKLAGKPDGTVTVDVLVGNERLMADNSVDVDSAKLSQLHTWKEQGKSVVLVAARVRNPFDAEVSEEVGENQMASQAYTLSAMLAVADSIRPEAAPAIAALCSRGIAVWMLSGDNPTTAAAVAAQVGIDRDSVIAGVLPDQKADKIQYLQKTLPYRGRGKRHATVAMVGDGINDSPALTMADVGIAIGSGSDVAISSADFILISSNLTSLLTLIDLSRAVFRRVWFNFGWALVYNVVMMPIAAGALYAVVSNGSHVRLDPVWASLAMALSSVSVVTSSLLLRTKLPGIGFRERRF